MPASFVKDPASVLDYKFDWSVYLDTDSSPAETISTSQWSADAGITIDSDSKTDTDATVWLSGGVATREYEVTNKITTSVGRTVDRSFTVQVAQR